MYGSRVETSAKEWYGRQMNPYASFLGNRDPLEVIAGTAARLDSLSNKLGPKGLEESTAPGKWSVRQILCHLADCEVVFAYRLRQALSQDHHVIQPFDQDKWAEPYAGYDAHAALGVFSSLRQWNLTLLKSAGTKAHPKQVTHPERGTMTFRTLIETMAGHDLNHLQQVEAVAARA